jgi:uroporphyrinogen decarboxylase
MNPRERWGLLLIDEFPDRPPVFPLVTSHAAQVAGIDLIRYCTDGKALARAQLLAQQTYDHEGLSVFTDVGIIAEAMGSRYHLREYDVPILDRPRVTDLAMADDLEIPDPTSDGRLPVYLEAVEILFQSAGDILPVFAYIPCPFTTAAGLRGIEDFLMDTIMAPEAAHRLLEKSLDAAIRLCDACIIAGALPVLVDPLASGSVVSRKTFAELAHPYQSRLIAYLHRYDLDITLHVCGDTEALLDLIPQTGADLFSFDGADVQSAVETMGEQVRLVGNIPPNALLPSSTFEIALKAKEILREGLKNPRGFVLSTGCEVPIGCHPERLQTLIETGKRTTYAFEW